MLSSLTDEEIHNWYKLMFSEDPDCNILAKEIFNSFGNYKFNYRAIMKCLNPNQLYRSH